MNAFFHSTFNSTFDFVSSCLYSVPDFLISYLCNTLESLNSCLQLLGCMISDVVSLCCCSPCNGFVLCNVFPADATFCSLIAGTLLVP